MNWTLPLAAPIPALEVVGGKGRSLVHLIDAGFPVPGGFVVTTDAYRAHVAGLAGDAAAVADMYSAVTAGRMPVPVREAILSARAGRTTPVAVRSSATAEDLPEASFAGQQASFLHVVGDEALIEAVRACWASLWTERAIGYREHAGIDHASVAMAVVIQDMAPAVAAGVAFTADPVHGNRDLVLVNATPGLGEALVSGEVTPDSWVLSRTGAEPLETAVAAKTFELVPRAEGGIERRALGDGSVAALKRDQLRQLADLVVRVEQSFDGVPQDIEWVLTPDGFVVVQSRPITHLPDPEPVWDSPDVGEQFVRRQIVENMPDPVTPLFEDVYLSYAIESAMDRALVEYSVDFSVAEFVTRPMFVSINGYAYCRASYRFNMRSLPGMLKLSARTMPALSAFSQHWDLEGLPDYRRTTGVYARLDLATATNVELRDAVLELAVADARHWFDISIKVGIAKFTDGMLHFFVNYLVPGDRTSGMYLRGFGSPTLEAQDALRRVSDRVEARGLGAELEAMPAPEALELLRQDSQLGPLVNGWLADCGHQVYSLDFSEPTLGERPEAVMAAILNPGPVQPDTAEARDASVAETLAALDPVRGWLFKLLYRWGGRAAPGREAALFRMGAAWPVLRRAATELGQRLVAADVIARSEDVYFLRLNEIDAFVAGSPPEAGWQADVAARRELRQVQRRAHPPPMVPVEARYSMAGFDMSAFETQKRNKPDARELEGFAVSPGAVTAPACVVKGPEDFSKMHSGAVLVCTTTTPAWTSLFGQAAAVVTDIGGILAHGSIVAREYGIPAVLGTGDITRRVRDGQMLRVDGTAGRVTLL